MQDRMIACVLVASAVSSAALLGQGQAPSQRSQSPETPAVSWERPTAEPGGVPRTPWGKPDLQGIWSRHTLTPLERPAQFADKVFFTPEEAAAFEKAVVASSEADHNRAEQVGAQDDLRRAYNEFWWDRATNVAATRRTSLIVDPPNGRRPPLTPEAEARMKLEPQRAAFRGYGAEGRGDDSWLDRSTWERCITQGVPKLYGLSVYNTNQQIFQTPDTVVVLDEMIHEARVIPLDGRPHLPDGVRQWQGNSRGRWDGDTLVIETKGLTDKINMFGSTENLHLTERYTRINADMLLYEATLSDPTTWTRPWTVQLPMGKAKGEIYEYACHEGNRAMVNILAGARAQEKRATASPGAR